MYKNILIATDGSKLAGKAVQHGLQLAKALGASAVVVNVTEMWSPLEIAREAESKVRGAIDAYEAAAADHAKEILDVAATEAATAGVTIETVHVGDRHPSDGILEAARDHGCDLIVMATHGRRGLNRMMLGSQTNEVVTRSNIPVLVLR